MKRHSELEIATASATWSAVRCRLLFAAFLVGVQPGFAQEPVADAQRREIDAQRNRIEAHYEHQQWDCSQRFFVTSCQDRARVAQREAIAALDQREAELDNQERRERADRRLALIREKNEALARVRVASNPGDDGSAAAPVAGPAVLPETRGGRAPAKQPDVSDRAADRAAADRVARQRAEASTRRRLETAKQQAEGATSGSGSGKAAAPLPERPIIPSDPKSN